METINLGKVAFAYKGDYNPATTYASKDVVFDGESSYISKSDGNVGNALSNATFWGYLAKGNAALSEQNAEEIDTLRAATKKYVDDTKATVDAALLNKADLVGGKIPTSQLPAYVDDVLEYANLAAFPATGETGKIYVALDTNLTYRWSGTAYVEISKSLGLGETSSTAYSGDRGKTAYDHSQVTGNAHGTTASQIPNTPAGTIAATTVQGAINELDGDVVQVRADLNLDEYTIAEAFNLLYRKIVSLETIIANGTFKNLQVDNLTTVNAFNYNGAPLIVVGSTAPTSAPDFVGQTYVNTTAPGTVYSAKGNASVSDWKQTSN